MATDGGPGGKLRAAREEISVSRREVADALNLPVQVIEAIENNDVSQLPATVFTRGYVRSYAKLLELDPGPLVRWFDGAQPEASDREAGASMRFSMPAMPQERLLKIGAAIVTFLLALVVVLLVTGERSDQADAAELPAEELPDVEASLDIGSQVEPEVASAPVRPEPIYEADRTPAATARPEPSSGSSTQTRSTETVTAPAGEEMSELAAAVAKAQRSQARRITPAGDASLNLRFSDDCWVEVKSPAGRSLYSELSRAGDDLTLVGDAPFSVLLGYAPGVVLSFNGESIPLAPHTRNNVANLVLGQ